MKIYKMPKCPHCDSVNYELAQQFGAQIIDIHDPSYNGFIPDQVPALQAPGMTLLGPNQINALLNVIQNASQKKEEK